MSSPKIDMTVLIPNEDRLAYNRTGAALAKGDLVEVDLLGASTEAKTITAFDWSTDGPDAHPFVNVVPCTTQALTQGGVWLVALETIADNAVGKFRLKGTVDLECVGSSAIVADDVLTPTNAATYASLGVDGQINVAKALEDGPTGTAAATKRVLFDGFQLNPAGAAGS